MSDQLFHGGTPRVSRWRRRLALWTSPRGLIRFAALVICFGFVFVVGRASVEPRPDPTPWTQTVLRAIPPGWDENCPDSPGLIVYRDRMPSGFAATAPGARAAGVAYASEVEQKMLYLDVPSIERAQRQISATARVDQLVVERQRSVATWRESLKTGTGQLWWVVSPLAARVESITADRARVLVWVSFVVSRPGATAPRVWFGIQTVELVREADDWKIWSQSLDTGPTPQSAPGAKPSDATELGERLSGFSLQGWER